MDFLKGYKTYLAGIGLIIYAIGGTLLGLAGEELGIPIEKGIELFLMGLGILGLRAKLERPSVPKIVPDKREPGTDHLHLWPLLLICALPMSSMAATISGPGQVSVCSGLVRLSTTTTAEHYTEWEIVNPRSMDAVIYNDGRSMAFAAPAKAGTVTILLLDVWNEPEGGIRVETTYHDIVVVGTGPSPPPDPVDPVDPVDPIDPVDPVDPIDPVDPDDRPLPPIPSNLTGIARTAFVSVGTVPGSKRHLTPAVADTFSSVAASIAAGTTRTVDAAKSEIAERLNATLVTDNDQEAWLQWRVNIGTKLDELAAVGFLRTAADYGEQYRNVEKGLRATISQEKPMPRPGTTPQPYVPPTPLPSQQPTTSKEPFEPGNVPKTPDDFYLVRINGKRYAKDRSTGETYPVDEATKSFCIKDQDGHEQCFVISE